MIEKKKIKQFNGLLVATIELSTLCNKTPGCWMCGRRILEKDYPALSWFNKNMPNKLIRKIAQQLPTDIVVQFHNNGESLLHPNFGNAVRLFKNRIKCLNTNGKLILEKWDEIVDNLDTLTISVIPNDPEQDEQYEIVKKFLERKKNRKPFMIYRLLGNIENKERWYQLPGLVATRILHDPMGSFNYEKKVTIPEIGVCLDLLSHLVINVDGTVSMCIRFDPLRYGIIGDINKDNLLFIWNSKRRKLIIKEHLKGNRNCNQLCAKCDYFGIPRGE